MRTYWAVGVVVLLTASVFGAVQCANGSCGADFNAWDFFFGDLDRGMIIVTWVIAGLSLMQYQLAARTAQRQLRAYVALRKGHVHDFEPENPSRIELMLKNFGQTPAQQIHVAWCISLVRGTNERIIEVLNERPLGMLSPGAEYRLSLNMNKPFTSGHIIDVVAGTSSLFVSGRLDYTDSFGRAQWTTFKIAYSALSMLSGETSFCEDGNEAS